MEEKNKDIVASSQQETVLFQDACQIIEQALYLFIAFYQEHPNFFQSVTGKLLEITDDDVAHYSVLNGSDQLFAAKYLTYMPSRADLRREIEQQKEFFLLQHKK